MARIIKANTSGQMQAPLGAGSSASFNAATAETTVRGLDDLATEARTVMLDARRQAAKTMAEARAQADALRDAAAAKGYAEGLARGQNDGYEEGCRKGQADARQELADRSAEVIAQLQAIVGELNNARAEMLHAGRCELLELALLVAAKIVGRVAVRDISAARENVRKILELSDHARDLRVKVNPGQLKVLAEHMPELIDSLNHAGRVTLVGDETISPGGAKVHTADGEIDATIKTQLDNVVEALLGSRASDDNCGRYVSVSGSETTDSKSTAKENKEQYTAQ